MCGAYGFVSTDLLKDRFNIGKLPRLAKRYNIRPSQTALVLREDEGFQSRFGIDSWKEGQLLINARGETVQEKKTFKKMFQESRVLIPADFYYEWLKDGALKRPFAFALKSKEPFALAGLVNDSGFVILTTAPNSMAKKVHDRMPLILNRKDEKTWVNPDTDPKELDELLRPYPEEKMTSWEVSRLVNSALHDSEMLIKPVDEVKI